jgi:hypothetical protein
VRDTQLANRLRALGVRVIEVDGWQSRGSDSYAPVGGLWHHTAGPSSGATLSQQQYDSIMKRLDQLESQVQSVGSGQNKHIELSSDIKKDVLNSRARLVRSADGVYFVVTPEGRWRIENSGQFSVKNMIDWLTVVGLIAPGDSVKADDDYLHGVPKLADPGKVPST